MIQYAYKPSYRSVNKLDDKPMVKTLDKTQVSPTMLFGELSSRESIETRVKSALNVDQTVERISKAGKKKTVKIPAIGDRQIISARELWLYCVGESKPINWIESYKALLKYVSKDYVNIFQPIVKGDNSGTRYYVKVDNIVEFLWRFENNKL